MRIRVCLFLVLLAAANNSAQSTLPPRMRFEVASVRPSSPAASSGGVRMDGAQVHVSGFTLREYIARAYSVRPTQVLGPDWLETERFDVDANLPEGSKPSQIPLMMQALLEDRFALRQHRDQKDMPMYALTIGKPPLRLKESPDENRSEAKPEAAVDVTVRVGAGGVSVDLGHGASYNFSATGKFDGKRMTVAMIASTLERFADRPVLDMTGLTGIYDVSFEMTPEDYQALSVQAAINAGVRLPPQAMNLLERTGNPLPLATAQLGLKLDARRAPVEVVVVDGVRRVPLDN
jgi:uncharacterized protein (TIGR03435 family)